VRTWNDTPRIVAGDVLAFTVVDDNLDYVTVYVPKQASAAHEVERTINQALDTRAHKAPRERFHDG
jgi:hypothetical protein